MSKWILVCCLPWAGLQAQMPLAQTLEILQEIIGQEREQERIEGQRRIELQLKEQTLTLQYHWESFPQALNSGAYDPYDQLRIDLSKVKEWNYRPNGSQYSITLACQKGWSCLEYTENLHRYYSHGYSPQIHRHSHYPFADVLHFRTENTADLVTTGLRYLQNTALDQNKTITQNLSSKFCKDCKTDYIPLGRGPNVYTVELSLSPHLHQSFILDSGASAISMPQSFADQLQAEGLLSPEDYLEPGLYIIASGEVISQQRFLLPLVRIGDTQLSNIVCTINTSEDVFLLGNSLLNQFKSWKIDTQNHFLILEY
jgi:hypothetical protein